MASVNKVIIVGNLGADPDVKTFDNGGKIANVSIATSEKWNDRNTGEPREITEWHRVVFNDRLADVVAQYLRKGSQVYVEGSLRTRKWQDPQTGQDRYMTEIRANSMQMLGSRPSGGDYNGGNGGYGAGGNGGYGGGQGGSNTGNRGVQDNGYQGGTQNRTDNYPNKSQSNHRPYDNNFDNGGAGYADTPPPRTPPQGQSNAPSYQKPQANNQFGEPTNANKAGGQPADDDMPF